MTKRRICVVTGTRAEYGLLYWLLKELDSDENISLSIISTGMHLSPEYGLTYREIEKDFKIEKKIEILLSSDTKIGIAKSMGLAQISFAEAFDDLKPDLIVILGDRFEVFSTAASAMVMNIPIAHISGGELTEGAIDDAIRHSITKMSHLHFVATDEYKKRVIQLGEDPKRVFNFGEAGLDNISKLKLLSRDELEKSINFELNIKNLLITYHPATLESSKDIEEGLRNLLEILDGLEDSNLIFTKANADSNGRNINKIIQEYVKNNSKKSILFSSLGQLRYLSLLQFVDAIVGNTSSGLVEAPSFQIGTINIGSRQKGRIRAKSVIDSSTEKNDLKKAFETLYSMSFQKELSKVINPYRQEDSSKKTKEVLASVDLSKLINKRFKDL